MKNYFSKNYSEKAKFFGTYKLSKKMYTIRVFIANFLQNMKKMAPNQFET